MRAVRNGRAVFASTVPVTILKFHVNTVRTLRAQGYNVVLVSSDGADLEDAAEQTESSSSAIAMTRKISPFNDLAALGRWVVLLARLRPGVVIAGTPKCALLALVAARATRVPRRVYMCGGLRLEGESGWRRRVLAGMERMAMGAASEVVVNSRSLYDEVLAARMVRPEVLRQTVPGSSHGVDTIHFRPGAADELRDQLGLHSDEPVLGFVGRLTRDKGVDTLIDAAKILRDRGVAFRLLVVGPQDEPDSKVWLERLETSGTPTTITGCVADPAEYYRLMSLLLLPSRREGFPNVVLEAAASGVPAVTTDATGCRDAVVDGMTGQIVRVDEPTALADAVEELLADHSSRAAMGQRGRSWVENHFHPDDVAAQIVDQPVGRRPSCSVLHVLPSLNPGGAERLVVDLTTVARERGVDARIAVLGPTRPDSPVLVDARSRNLPVIVLGTHRFDPRGLLRLRRLASSVDIVHAHLFPSFYAVALVCSGRLVVTEHSPTNSRRERHALRRLEGYVYSRYSVKVAVSDGVAASLSGYLDSLDVPGPIRVVENGVRLDRFMPVGEVVRSGEAWDDARLRLVAIGSLDARKDVGVAVRVIAGVPGVRLTVVGDGPERSRLEHLALALGAEVTFLGLRADVPQLLREHDALIMTSRYEGFGLVAAEAMASGLPVLAPDLPGLNRVVGDGGLLHVPGDEGGLMSNILRLRDDDDLRRRLGQQAWLRSRGFDLERTVEAYLDIYALPTGRR